LKIGLSLLGALENNKYFVYCPGVKLTALGSIMHVSCSLALACKLIYIKANKNPQMRFIVHVSFLVLNRPPQGFFKAEIRIGLMNNPYDWKQHLKISSSVGNLSVTCIAVKILPGRF